jgi:hypothetical protein
MDMNKPPRGLVTPMPPAQHAIPAEEPADDGERGLPPVLGPADSMRPSAPNPMSIVAPSGAEPLLATLLHWRR